MGFRVIVVAAVVLNVLALVLPWVDLRRVTRLRAADAPWPDIAARTWVGRRVSVTLVEHAPLALAVLVAPAPYVDKVRWFGAGAIVVVGAAVVWSVHEVADLRLHRQPVTVRVLARVVRSAVLHKGPLILLWPAVAYGTPRQAFGVVVLSALGAAVWSVTSFWRWKVSGAIAPLPDGSGLAPLRGESLWTSDSDAAYVHSYAIGRFVVVSRGALEHLDRDALRSLHAEGARDLDVPWRLEARLHALAGFVTALVLGVANPQISGWVVFLVLALFVVRRSALEQRARLVSSEPAWENPDRVRAELLLREQRLAPVVRAEDAAPNLLDRARAAGVPLPPVGDAPAPPSRGGRLATLAFLAPLVVVLVVQTRWR